MKEPENIDLFQQIKESSVEEDHNHDDDGVDNSEHILDEAMKVDLLFQNIQNNTDNAILLLKSFMDKDEVDALKIDCARMLDIEKEAERILDTFKKSAVSFSMADKKERAKRIKVIEECHDYMVNAEKYSNDTLENMIKKVKD